MSVSPPHQRMVYLGQRSHVPIADIHPARRSLRDQAGTSGPKWLLRVVGAAALAHPTGVVPLPISRDRRHECYVMHCVTCTLCWFAILAVLGPRAGVLACDVQGLEQGPVQELLRVCPVALVSSVRALRSPAVLRLSDQACIPVVATPIE